MMNKIIIFLLGWLAGDVSTLIFLFRWATKNERKETEK